MWNGDLSTSNECNKSEWSFRKGVTLDVIYQKYPYWTGTGHRSRALPRRESQCLRVRGKRLCPPPPDDGSAVRHRVADRGNRQPAGEAGTPPFHEGGDT